MAGGGAPRAPPPPHQKTPPRRGAPPSVEGGAQDALPGVAPIARSCTRSPGRRDLAGDPGADPGEDPGLETVVLAVGVQRGRPGERGVDLLLAVVRVVVLREVLEVRGEVLDLHTERRHAEAGPRAAEAAAVR